MFLVENFKKIELLLRYFDIFIVQSGVWENKTFYSMEGSTLLQAVIIYEMFE